MMPYIETFHRLDDKAAFDALMIVLGWPANKPANISIVPYGNGNGHYYTRGSQIGTNSETGEPVYDLNKRDGFHFNIVWPSTYEMPTQLAASRIIPATASQRHTGIDLSGPTVLVNDGVPITYNNQFVGVGSG
jgi:hypothetical protein